ncbi:MAG: GNAT family N-acetyltransferase [Lentimicrobium sp.]|nr:GNAT family N-acetyltransferase [Lentimicrobium sp.]
MILREVKDKKEVGQFLDLARKVYKGDKNWICPLDSMVEAVFDPGVNIFFSHGEATRWVLYNDNGESIGRVAAFINRKKAFNFDQPTGGMGFFECINDRDAAFLLFNTSKQWLIDRGMEAMDGPVNFGENDNFWGLLVEGFMPQSFGMNYHHPYYREFFESYGFKPYFDQVTNHLDLRKPFPERFWKIADWVRQRPGYTFKHFNWKESTQLIEDFKSIYDDAWQFHENFTPIVKEDLLKSLSELKPIMVEEFIWFAYHDNEPIAFLVMIPDANELFKHFNGKIGFFGKLKFLYLKKINGFSRTRITVMGIKPKYQKSGIEAAIFWHMDKVMKQKPNYREVELSWVGDFNPKMRQLHESVGGYFAKRHITYRYLFNAAGESQRATSIPSDTRERALKSL